MHTLALTHRWSRRIATISGRLPKIGLTGYGCIFIVGLVLLGGILSVFEKPRTPVTAVVAPITPQPPPSKTINSGDNARLRAEKDGDIPVAASEADLSRLVQLASVKDDVGMDQMISAGRVWSVPRDTKCLVIDRGFLKSEVRLSEGLHAGRSGWVSSDFLKE